MYRLTRVSPCAVGSEARINNYVKDFTLQKGVCPACVCGEGGGGGRREGG